MFTPEINWRLTKCHEKNTFLIYYSSDQDFMVFYHQMYQIRFELIHWNCVSETLQWKDTQNREQGQVISTHTHTLTHTDICWCSANSEVLEVRRQRPLLWLTGCHHQEIKQQNPDNNTHNNHQADWVRVTLTLSYTHTHTQYIDTQCTAQMSSWVTECFWRQKRFFCIWLCCQCSASIDEHLSNNSVFQVIP